MPNNENGQDSLFEPVAIAEHIPGGVDVLTPGNAIVPTYPLQQVKTQYVTAVAVQNPRVLAVVERDLMARAAIMAEEAYYSWTVTDKRTGKVSLIEGPSIDLCLEAAKCFRNCAVEQDPVLETPTAWIFSSRFVDIESGVTLPRQFRQSRARTVHGRIGADSERADEIRFNIGQSKSTRNAINDGVGRWILNRAMQAAKKSTRTNIEDWIKKHSANGQDGLKACQDLMVSELAKFNVSSDMILRKFSRPTVGALTIDDLVSMRGDINALRENKDTVQSLYSPNGEESNNGSDATSSKTEQLAKAMQEAQNKTTPASQEQQATTSQAETSAASVPSATQAVTDGKVDTQQTEKEKTDKKK